MLRYQISTRCNYLFKYLAFSCCIAHVVASIATESASLAVGLVRRILSNILLYCGAENLSYVIRIKLKKYYARYPEIP